jgi:shikimate dehydrogenase
VITAQTRLVALLGHPVSHSLSPRMQNAAFAARGLDWAYVALDVALDRFDEAVKGLAAAGFSGANVTTPFKHAAVEAADVVDDTVLMSGSANTLLFRNGEVEARSTDTEILRGLETRRPAIIGSGGAATAFAFALPHARVFSRRDDWPPRTDDADLVVHATPVRDEVLFEPRAGQTVVDLPYPDSATAAAARAVGARVFDGLEVLVAQGAASFELWTGIPAPIDVMRAAVRSDA